MVSFSCENCGDVLTKKKLDPHRNQCYGASFTCLDCMVHFRGTDYRAHTSCISEAQKYQGHLYKEKKTAKGQQHRRQEGSQAVIPRKAYVEDVPEDNGVVAVINVPPAAPSPPPAAPAVEGTSPNVNVFDFLVTDETQSAPKAESGASKEARMIEPQAYTEPYGYSQPRQMFEGHDTNYYKHGFAYGSAPVEPSMERHDSWAALAGPSFPSPMPGAYYDSPAMPPPYVTPAPKQAREKIRGKEKERHGSTSDKKRKRHQLEELDMALVRQSEAQAHATILAEAPQPLLHSGLTGGLSRLLARPDFPPSPDYSGGDGVGRSPLSPTKRSKKDGKEGERDGKRKLSHGATKTSSSHRTETEEESKHRRHLEDPRRGEDEHRRRRHRRRRESLSSEDDHHHKTSKHTLKAIDSRPHRSVSAEPSAANQIVSQRSRAELFLTFVTKGPESERGCSVNKALKRYHRERDVRGEEKEEEDKGLWKGLRIRRNERGEFVLFV
ncbi:hypothetical protein LTR50_001005 [Elasticomyces elasticus]|nr:hypothetical protein LTR50_001005 [Elasticomyces elasticus]